MTLKVPDFKFSEGTVEFIRIMNDELDMFNSRQMTDAAYKKPNNEDNYQYIMTRLEYANSYLKNLKCLMYWKL